MNTMQYQSTKVIEGFSTCFRQWKADDTHCKFLHGYAISFKVIFEADCLDNRNWVMDFGFMKRSKTPMAALKGPASMAVPLSVNDWFKYMFDHTTIIAEDDPYLESFISMDRHGVIQLRTLPKVGCEIFAQFVYEQLERFLHAETNGRVKVKSVECSEHSKNSAIYGISHSF